MLINEAILVIHTELTSMHYIVPIASFFSRYNPH